MTLKIRERNGNHERREIASSNGRVGISSSSNNNNYTNSIQDYILHSKDGIVKVPATKQGTTSFRQYTSKKSSISVNTISVLLKIQTILSDLFLPLGFPESVESSYLQYQAYDSLQGLCSYLRGVVSTSAVLSAAGVGNSEVTALSAAVSWALRDGVGMIGGLLFSYVSASHFDSHVKEFRLFADVINDVGLTLDMIAPLLPFNKVLYVSAIATVCKVMCGMAAGATKASITAHFALRGNMADLNAKESTQETLVTLIGMIFGISLAKYVNTMEPLKARNWVWFVFITLTVVHVWANYKGVMLLRLNTLNRQRVEEALHSIIVNCSEQMHHIVLVHRRSSASDGGQYNYLNDDAFELPNMIIPTPDKVKESIVESTRKLLFRGRIRLGVSIVETCNSMSGDDAVWLISEEFVHDPYILGVNEVKMLIYISLKTDATENDQLKAFAHALLIDTYIQTKQKNITDRNLKSTVPNIRDVIKISHNLVRRIFGDRISGRQDSVDDCEKHLSLDKLNKLGWNCERIYLGFGKYRVDNIKID